MKVRLLLYPFSLIYAFVMYLRRKLYQWDIFQRQTFPIKTIGIGNLRVGGTGKTPHVEHFIKLLSEKEKIATLSRGYGRKSKGFILASEQKEVTAALIGDEPMQYFSKFPNIEVVVCENRCEGIEKLLQLRPEITCIILDDCYQHLSVQCHEYYLLTEYERLYCDDFPFPAGNLRECRAAANFAQNIIVSKCPPNISEDEKIKIRQKLKIKTEQKLLFSSIQYQELAGIFNNIHTPTMTNETEVLLVAGIGNPKPIIEHLSSQFKDVHTCIFPDHHPYSESDLEKITREWKKLDNAIVITTEKDAMRLRAFQNEEFSSIPIYFLPIEIIIS